MRQYVDIDLGIAVAGLGSRSPAPQQEVKSADVLDYDVRFVSAGQIVDLTSAAVVSFGLVQASQPGSGLLVECQLFNRMDDGNVPPLDVWYRGQPNFYTTN